MSVQDVMARIGEIQSQLAPKPVEPAPSVATATAASSANSQFSSMLDAQGTATADPTAGSSMMAFMPGLAGTSSLPPSRLGATSPFGAASSGGSGAAIVQAAASQVGVTEQPPGSNDSPQIASYRTATAGAGVGPWCAYFASWAARQAGTPLGEQGQGFGSVSALAGWAQRTGRLEPPGTRPGPGDLIVWGGEHVGVVEGVDANGSIHTIEGNSSNAVSRRTYGPDGGGATGYVRLS